MSDSDSPFLRVEDRFLQKIKFLVEENLSDSSLSIPVLAGKAGMSRVQLYRKIKTLTGTSPSLFVRSIRLQYAEVLLLQTNLNVSEIAYDVGFKDPAFFSRAFKKAFGKPPSIYREDGK